MAYFNVPAYATRSASQSAGHAEPVLLDGLGDVVSYEIPAAGGPLQIVLADNGLHGPHGGGHHGGHHGGGFRGRGGWGYAVPYFVDVPWEAYLVDDEDDGSLVDVSEGVDGLFDSITKPFKGAAESIKKTVSKAKGSFKDISGSFKSLTAPPPIPEDVPVDMPAVLPPLPQDDDHTWLWVGGGAAALVLAGTAAFLLLRKGPKKRRKGR